MNLKKLVFGFILFSLFVFVCNVNLFAECIYNSTTTDGRYIYHAENDKIYRYDMQGNNKTEIYEGLPYGINIEGLYGNYLYFNEFTEYVDGIDADCNLKVLNLNDNTFKVVADIQSRVHNGKDAKVYIQRAVRGDYSPIPLYCADIDGDNYKLITEISNSQFVVVNNKLYYAELDDSDYSHLKHRVKKSDLDGANSETVIDWFISDSAYLNETGVVWCNNPLRFVSEALGAEVNWDGENRVITVTASE